jgi:toxic protein SymE
MRPNRHPAPPAAPYRASSRGGAGKPRELSITTLFRPSNRTRTGETPVPYLRLSGRWLEQHGFTPGSRITVTAENGKLVLTIAAPPPCT